MKPLKMPVSDRAARNSSTAPAGAQALSMSVGDLLHASLAPDYLELTHDGDYRGGDFRLIAVSTKFVGLSGSQVQRHEIKDWAQRIQSSLPPLCAAGDVGEQAAATSGCCRHPPIPDGSHDPARSHVQVRAPHATRRFLPLDSNTAR